MGFLFGANGCVEHALKKAIVKAIWAGPVGVGIKARQKKGAEIVKSCAGWPGLRIRE